MSCSNETELNFHELMGESLLTFNIPMQLLWVSLVATTSVCYVVDDKNMIWWSCGSFSLGTGHEASARVGWIENLNPLNKFDGLT